MERIRSGWRRQLLLFLAAYVIYDLARWVFAGDPSAAVTHAHSVLRLERAVHVAIESSVQHALGAGAPSWVLGYIYLAAQFAVPPAALVWLYRHSPEVYRGLRDTMLATWLIAIPIFALFPVAPPRLAERGIVDTVSHQAGVSLTGRSTIFYNPFAAVPSLHVGFAVAIGVALFVALRPRWAKALALLWGPTVSLAVLATGNHYLFDIAAGLLVTVSAFVAAQLIRHRSDTHPLRRRPPGPRLAEG
jgi:membrane-associated phospholipid phosphatase